MSDLKLIGAIRKNQKLDTIRKCIQQDDWVTTIRRSFLTIDNRHNAFEFISSTIDTCFDLCTLFLTQRTAAELEICKQIRADLQLAIGGATNLKGTYVTDIGFGCQIDQLVDITIIRLATLDQHITKLHNEFYPESPIVLPPSTPGFGGASSLPTTPRLDPRTEVKSGSERGSTVSTPTSTPASTPRELHPLPFNLNEVGPSGLDGPSGSDEESPTLYSRERLAKPPHQE